VIDSLLDLALHAIVVGAVVWTVMALAFRVPFLPRRKRTAIPKEHP
jgi:hypothetical protein